MTPIDSYRRPSLRAILACCVVAALALAADLWFSSQEGYLARPPDYDGVGYLYYAQAPYHLIQGLHLRTALHQLNNVAPLWTAVLTAHYLVLGGGTWQAFTARFWPTALLLVLVYWIVRRRAPRPLAIAAAGLTTVLPLVSAGVRSSSWEFLSGQANYNDNWGLDDLRPDFLAAVLVLWSVALLAEHSGSPRTSGDQDDSPRTSGYLLSAAFAAAAVLMKPSTGPVALAAWMAAMAVTWFWNRRAQGIGRMTALAVGFLALLLLPWATLGHGVSTTATYFYEAAVTFKGAYAMNLGLVDSATYYLVRIPSQLGQLEAWPVILGALFAAVALLRRRLGRAEWIYGGLVVLFYGSYTATSNKNPHVGEWFSLALWIFFLASVSRLAAARWPVGIVRFSPRLLAVVSVYAVVVLGLGAFSVFNWPRDEQRANTNLVSVTAGVAGELNRHVSAGQCFSYAPGPGWPASLELLMINSDGASPQSTPIDVDPASTTGDYVAAAAKCPAIVVYREDVTQVAKVFFCPPVRQPYLGALASWVRNPGSGYALDRSWQFTDLPPIGPHTLGRYQGISLTVDLYLRT